MRCIKTSSQCSTDTMDYRELEKILSEYVRRFAEFDNPGTHDEGYKWRAISHFQRNWNIDADRNSFLKMFRAATAKQVNLFDGRHQHPLNGIRKLLRDHGDHEFIRQQFSALFSSDGGNYAQRQERAQLFAEAVNSRVRHFYPAEDDCDHSLYDAINYLSFWRPAENFICKPYSANKVAGIINFGGDIGYGTYFSLVEYYKMCEEISEALDNFPEILERSEARRLREAPELDSTASRHITVYDIIYCAYQYDLNGVQSRPSVPVRERLATAENRKLLEAKEAEIADLRERLRTAESASVSLPDLSGQIVHHKTFGDGTVQSCTSGMMAVAFPKKDKPVSFIYSMDKRNCVLGGFIIPESESVIGEIQSAFDCKDTVQRLTHQIETATKELNKLLGK